MKKNDLQKYLFSLLLFGSNGIVASFIALDSMHIVLLRTLIGSLCLVMLFLIAREKPAYGKNKRQFMFIVISGMSLGASWIFLYEAYARIGVSVASLLYYCGPVIVIALSPLVFKEHLTLNKLAGLAAVLTGVTLINGDAMGSGSDTFGIICGLMSAVFYAVMVIFNKKASDITGLENSALQITSAFFAVAIFAGLTQGFATDISADSLLPILILGVVNTGLGCYLYFSSIGRLPVHTVAICGYLEPLSAVLFSVVILRETLLPLQIVGAVLIIGGAMFSELAKKAHV